MVISSREHFDAQAAEWGKKYSQNGSFRERYRVLTDMVPEAFQKPGVRIADIGCGAGNLSHYFLERGCQVTGLDQSQEMLDKAGVYNRDYVRKGRAEFILGDALHTSFQDRTFDFLVASSILEYLDDPDAFGREIHRLLRPGGQALISVPNRRSFYRKIEPALYRFFSLGARLSGLKTLKRLSGSLSYLDIQQQSFTQESLADWGSRHGLSVKANRHYGLPGPLYRSFESSCLTEEAWLGTLMVCLFEKIA